MAGILSTDANLSDSDSDDCDYVPEKEVDESSCSEVEPDAEENQKARKKRRETSTVENAEGSNTEENKKATDLTPEQEKKRVEEVWSNFLSDVGKSAAKNSKDSANNSATEKSKLNPEQQQDNKVKVTEVFEFAGETVSITKEVDADPKQLAKTNSPTSRSDANLKTGSSPIPTSARKRQGGLGSLVGSILNKKPKMTTLQKSLHDWNTFKQEEGLQEDLERFNKGKGGYLEKQAFLQRSDLRQFEIEKNIRLSRKKL